MKKLIETLKKKLNLLKSNYNEEILLDLALLNASVGNNEASKLYIDEYKKLCNSAIDIKVPYDTLKAILDTNYHKKWKSYRRERNQNEKKRFALTASLCKGDVLEIGCGNGDLSSYISMYGHRLFGIDIDPVAIELARYKVWNFGLSDCYFNVCDANNLSLPDNAFDTVVLAEILEYVSDPLKVINEAKRVCKNDGIIIISVPRGYRIPDEDHIHIFNTQKIIELLKNIGINEDDIYWENNIPDEWILCWFNINKEENKSINDNNSLLDCFIPPHPLEDLSKVGKVSIILPTFNGQAYIQEAVDSILGQTYQNFELIVIDDGSTDKTYEKLKHYIDKGTIRYFYQENSGKPTAINKGIEKSNGEYIWIFDDDDTALPRKLEVHMRHFLRNPSVDIIHTSSVYTDANNRVPLLIWDPPKIEQKDMLKSKLHGCLFHGGSVIVKKECYLKVGKWDERLIRAQDYDMWIRLSRICNIHRINIPTVTYRQHKKVRGSKNKPIPFEKVAATTREYEKIIMRKVYKNIPLEEIFPELSKTTVNEGLKVSALIERAFAMAKRDLFDYALKDLKEAFDIAVVNYPIALTHRGLHFINQFNKEISKIKDKEIKKIVNYFLMVIAAQNTVDKNRETKAKPTVSLCIIAKDEEKNIARCINSVKDIVDEIVVVDTGSKDKTVEIAEGLDARVIHTKWEDDFSKARNTAIDNAKCDWILFLDADEVVKREDVGKIRPLLNDDTVEAYMFKFINYGGDSISSGLTSIHYNFKLFRNNGKLRYVYPIHENLRNVVDKRDLIYKDSGITILHYGYLKETRIEKNKTQRNINMISKYLMTHPNDMFQHLNLGVEYFNAEEYNKALKHLQIAEKGIRTNSPLKIKAIRYLIQTHTALKNYDVALKIANSAKAMYDKIPDFYFLEGIIYVEQKRYQKAIETFNKCISIGEFEGMADIIGGAGSYRAKYMIAFCYEKQGKLHDAVKDYINLLITRPGFKEVFIKLFDIFVTNETPKAVREFFDKYVDKSDPENYAILARLYMNLSEFEIAKQYLEDVNIDAQGLNNLKGMVHMGLKNFKEALQYFVKEYGKAKNVSNYYTALCHIILKDYNQAKDVAWKLENSGDKKLFLTIIGELRAKFDEVKDAYFQLLEFLLKINEFELCNELLNTYVSDFSRDDYVRYGKMMHNKGLEELAVKSYITAADRNSQDAQVYRYLAKKALENGMYDEALVMAAKALNLDNKDIENYVLIYDLYKTMGQNDEAEQINRAVKTMYEEIDLSEWNT